MADYIIVGAGISGLIAAHILNSQGKDFVGLEKEEKLGGRADTGHHRILNEKSVDYIRRWQPSEWKRVDEAPRERKKGEWAQPETTENLQETFYLQPSFYQPQKPFADFLNQLAEPVSAKFETKKIVDKIDTTNRKVLCQDGSEYTYTTLIWCSDLSLLRKLIGDSNPEIAKILKKEPNTFGGLNIDFQLESPLFEFQNTMIFPFRFKDNKLRALGVQDGCSLHWLLFLEDELSEDREEVAKIIRSLKRELQKEFPRFAEVTKHEKITFLPRLSGDEPVELKNLQISTDIIYLGPQSRLKDESEETLNAMNIDRSLLNCQKFEALLAGN